jgi:hypothetical protein
MPQLCLTGAGTLALFDDVSGRRYDVTTDAAHAAAVLCDEAAAAGHSAITIATIDGKGCRYDADADAFRRMASDLRGAARMAREYAGFARQQQPRRVQIGGRG